MSAGAMALGVGLLFANGFFVAAEFALLAARRSRIEQLAAEGNRAAAHALAGLKELSLMLAGAQLGITMASLGLGAVAEPALAAVFEHFLEGFDLPAPVIHGIAFTVALSIVVFLHMVVGEMAPKSLAISNPERSALLLARPFRAFTLLFRPFIRLLNALANGVVRLAGVEPQDELAGAHAPGDLLMLVRESAAHGLLPSEQHGLLERALDMSGLDAEATMIPRPDVVAVPGHASIADIERVASETGRSRILVYEDELDRVAGVLHVKDLLGVVDDDRERLCAADLARPCFFTVESRPIEDLMLEMREARAHVAVVVDEFGSVSGLTTLEDLIEELIGDFEDETDASQRRRVPSRHPIRRGAGGRILLPGAIRPDELEDQTGVKLPEGDYETVAGFVIAVLGRVPDEGDVVQTESFRLEVTAMDGPRVVELGLTRDGASSGPDR
jgi:CBS domain containing-hemolysin-like protein